MENTSSQIFDFGRFSGLLRREVSYGWRGWLLKFVIVTALLTLILYITTKFDVWRGEYGSMLVVFRFFSFLVLALGASAFMSNMTTSGDRLNTLMNPCSALEKYLSRWLIYVPGVFAGFVLSFMLAEVFSMMFMRMFYNPGIEVHLVDPLSAIYSRETVLFFYVFLFAVQSTYVLGSAVAPKKAFVKTSGVLVALGVAWICLVTNVYGWIIKPGCYIHDNDITDGVETAFILVCLCWTVFCYVTAYFRLKESEIIERL